MTVDLVTRKTTPKDQWHTLTVNQLIDEKNIMIDRLIFLQEQSAPYVKQFQTALDELEALIKSKLNI